MENVKGNGEILSLSHLFSGKNPSFGFAPASAKRYAQLLAQYGGVAPKQAEEAHSRVIDKVVVQDALDRANLTETDLSAVAVTIGPGLGLCLRVGVHKARRVAGAFNLPIVGVHHMEAHALVARLVEHELSFPFMALLISGGHNIIVLAHKLGQYTQLGTTVDDAIGEAFDKTAKGLGLDLRRSGGPAVEELALEGDSKSVMFNVSVKLVFSLYGGGAPKQAEEEHSRFIDKVVKEALDRANFTENDLSAVAVTIGPGLGLCLRVVVQKAPRVAGSFNLPIVGVHHMEARACPCSQVPMKHHKDCNFSYASLKTQVRLATEARDMYDAKCPVSCATKEDRRNRADMNIWSETAKLSDHLNMSSSGSNE
ncbi:hypothetical protein F2Q68_00024118 [Brassica cretica]|uniref:N(6)-L-threonylcarbamoyladenine synthase n=1 Tax=Brassica cretica TaxID=69181 RepID=A0A8S9IHE6_BRACR|nr:hypothetical protein F2Q68_00024118 [Brassica cretica]